MLTPELTPSDIKRYWSKVDRRGPDECWPWSASKNDPGYGRFSVCHKGSTTKLRSHRVAFYLAHGHWPHPVARHSCDNPPCCNPLHILEGTHKDNTADMLQRGRGNWPGHNGRRRGSGNPNAKLTEHDVASIKSLMRDGHRRRDIATQYHVSIEAITNIATGRTWKNTADNQDERISES